jgi:nicotinamidase-related amidase
MTTPLDPARTALLVMDLQNGVVSPFPDAEPFVERTAEAIVQARAADATIGYVRVGLTEAEAAAVPATNRIFATATGRRLNADDPETAIVDRLAPEPGDVVVRKRRVGAFSTTDLDEQLRRRGIDTLVLTGIATSGVVLSTVRDAADRDYRILVVEDLCLDSDPEVHAVLTGKVFTRQCEVIDSATFVRLLGTD